MKSSEAGGVASEAADMNVTWLDSPALPLILQLASSRPADAANLLLTSKAIHSAVLASCKGVTSVYYLRPDQARISVPTLTAWIAKYGQLIGDLCFAPEFEATVVGDQARAAAEQALAASLQQAASAGSSTVHPGTTSSGTIGSGDRSGLLLHSMQVFLSAGIDAVAVLQQLPGRSLTSLGLIIQQSHSCISNRNPGDYLRCFSNSLLHLTNLRDLRFVISSRPSTDASVDHILQQLSRLTNLRQLELEGVLPTDTALQLLPKFLKKLQLRWKCDASRPPQLHMTHLTALTSLTCWQRLPMDCLLPSSLVTLRAANLMHSSCLRPLKALQKLDLNQYQGAGDNLHHMSVLTSLTHVKVAFGSLKNVDLSGCAWRIMPVKELIISGHDWVPQQTVHHLGQLTQLTCLRLECPIGSSPAAFAAALQRMAQLKTLDLKCGRQPADSEFFGQQTDNGKSSAMHVFMALASLHHLQTLCLHELPINSKAAQLTATIPTRQLKYLSLVDCSLDNSTLTAILTAMPLAQIETLNIDKNSHVDDTVLNVVAGLPKLRVFLCYHTCITPSGCLRLLPHVDVHCGGCYAHTGRSWENRNGVTKYCYR